MRSVDGCYLSLLLLHLSFQLKYLLGDFTSLSTRHVDCLSSTDGDEVKKHFPEGEHMSQGPKCLIGALVLLLSGCAAVGGNAVPPSVDVSGNWAGTSSFHNPTMRSGGAFMNLRPCVADCSG